jgi:hypothetical protein
LGKLDEAEDYYKQTVQALISHGAKKVVTCIIRFDLKARYNYIKIEDLNKYNSDCCSGYICRMTMLS